MKFTELTKNTVITPSKELCDFWGIPEGVEVDFFIELERHQVEHISSDGQYVNYGHYVVLLNGLLELFCNGAIEVRHYNQPIDIFRIARAFQLQKIELEPTSGWPEYEVVSL